MINKQSANGEPRRVRYAVVGLGWISQVAMLPAFEHAKENSELTALVSDDPVKLRELSQKYNVHNLYTYDDYERCLNSGEIDAVYIGLPNDMHADYTIRAANAGIHVLCEKPMASTSAECRMMIEAAERNNIKLMIAYRLHFEEGNLKASDIVHSGDIGEPRYFISTNSQQVEEGNIRLDRDLGRGALDDIGIYCINAARYLFRAEPLDVVGFSASKPDPRFDEVPEMLSVTMRFPGERLAQFTCSFGAAKQSVYQVVGTKGDLKLDPAYGFDTEIKHQLTIGDKTKSTTFKQRDQFAAQLLHFSRCVLENQPVEPSGEEGLTDILIIEAIRQSILENRAIQVDIPQRSYRPTLDQSIKKPAVKEPELVNAAPPGGKEK